MLDHSLNSDLKKMSQIASLEDFCLQCVVVQLHKFSAKEMSRVPYRLRYKILQNLALADLWKRERIIGQRMGVDMGRVWEQFARDHCVSTEGLDFIHDGYNYHPEGKATFLDSIDDREICFQRLWTDLEALRHYRKPEDVPGIHSLLFSPAHDPFHKDFPELVPADLKVDDATQDTLTRCVVKDFVVKAIEVLSQGRPRYFHHSGIMHYLKPSRDNLKQQKRHKIVEQLLSDVIAVNTPSEEIEEEWFDELLSNGVQTLKLCVRYDLFQYVQSGVKKCSKKKKLDELIIRLRDEVIPMLELSRLIGEITFCQSSYLRLLDISSLHQQHLAEQTKTLVSFTSTLLSFLRRPHFACLRLSGVIGTTQGKSLILTFLSTPCSSAQRLEISSMYADREEMQEEQTLPADNDYYTHKSLFLDSVRMMHAKVLNMDKYRANIKTIREYYLTNVANTRVRNGSLTSWLLSLPTLKVGSLEIHDYSRTCANADINATSCIEALKAFIVFRNEEEECMWSSSLFRTAVALPTLRKCLWDLRFLSLSKRRNYHLEKLLDTLRECLPSENSRILSITVNKNIEPSLVEKMEQNILSIPELAFTIETNSCVQEQHL